jgi:hypothetical protein
MDNILVVISFEEPRSFLSCYKNIDATSTIFSCKVTISQEKYNEWQKIKKAYDNMQEEFHLIYGKAIKPKK